MAGPGGKSAAPQRAVMRLDKWLWQARFFRSRQEATETIVEGRLRLNGQHMRKPGHSVGAGDVLTFVQAGRVRVVRVQDLGLRRGPASEALLLYLDLDLAAATVPPQRGTSTPETGQPVAASPGPLDRSPPDAERLE